MGRHARQGSHAPVVPSAPPSRAADAPETMLGWGAFATIVASVLVGVAGYGWTSAALVAALGAGATGALWLAAARTRRSRHASGRGRARSVKCPRDQRER